MFFYFSNVFPFFFLFFFPFYFLIRLQVDKYSPPDIAVKLGKQRNRTEGPNALCVLHHVVSSNLTPNKIDHENRTNTSTTIPPLRNSQNVFLLSLSLSHVTSTT